MFGENNKFTFGASLGQTTQQSLLTKPTVTGAFTFGQPQTQPVFGSSTLAGFGAKPAFGFNSAPQPSLFGTNTASIGFGSFGSTPSAFGQTQQMSGTGTAIAKYRPHSGTDTLVRNGRSENVITRQHCITAMREYENKSLEELRLEDYANKKGPNGDQSVGWVGSILKNKNLFGVTASQPQSTDVFGAQSTTGDRFGTNAVIFGRGEQPKMFGKTQASCNIFGAMPPTDRRNRYNRLVRRTYDAPLPSTSTSFNGLGASKSKSNICMPTTNNPAPSILKNGFDIDDAASGRRQTTESNEKAQPNIILTKMEIRIPIDFTHRKANSSTNDGFEQFLKQICNAFQKL